MRCKLVAIAFVFLMIFGVFSVAPEYFFQVSAGPVGFDFGGFNGGPVILCGDPVGGGGSGGGD